MGQLTNLTKALAINAPLHWGGITKGFDAQLIGRIWHALKASQSLVIICHDEKELLHSEQFLQFFDPELPCYRFLPWDCSPYDRVSPSRDIAASRLSTLASLAQKHSPCVLLTTARTFLERLPPKAFLAKNNLSFHQGTSYGRTALIDTLINQGYHRTDVVREPGEFSVRGALIDIFPVNNDKPVRLDFFDDVLESIKSFDPFTQRSINTLSSFHVIPSSEVLLTPETIAQFKRLYRQHFNFESTKDALYEAVTAKQYFPGLEHWLGFFYKETAHLLDYVENPVIIFTQPFQETLVTYFDHITEQYNARVQALTHKLYGQDTSPYRPIPLTYQFFDPSHIQKKLEPYKQITFSTFTPANEDLHFDSSPLPPLPQTTQHPLSTFAQATGEEHKPSYLVYQTKSFLEKHAALLSKAAYTPLAQWGTPKKPGFYCLYGQIPHGFRGDSCLLYTEHDLLGYQRTHTKPRKTFKDITSELLGYQPGDFIVHRAHGIGQFCALTPIVVNHITHDCVELLFANNDKLFVPVENLDVLTKYAGNDTLVALDKLGHTAWQKRKASVKKRLFDIAEKLLHTAALRAMHKGIAIPYHEETYRPFAEDFPYDETEDQRNAIDDVIDDLLSDKPMDRLICGDVGYGKTEVAMRAAFLAATAGYQVVVLTPTTILAQQHTKSFQERFKNTGFKIAQLSRLISPKQATATKKALADGTIDILISTHAALAKSFVCPRLGLVIIDEEQHFGVTQKEQLKKKYETINILTLTATPIPRTLQMALHGIRDMSLIATPPMDRLAIRSFVAPFDPVIMREAILREYHRGGQVYFVCPRIADIEKVEKKLKTLVPEITLAIAHGQMPPTQLQKVMENFAAGAFQVLLATNIVESGLDIPRANTLFVYNADLFGLSQLYQLRGRIGRSKQRAYAYFLLPERRQANAKAQKRLEIMQTLEGLGAGFALASHDMDIRGAGNLVGDAQSGHIKEVGIELYQQMLEETVASLKETHHGDVAATADWTPQLNIQLPVFIPEDYIPDLSLRMGIYRRISELRTDEAIIHFKEELLDRFGTLPDPLTNLLAFVRLKNACRQAYIEKIDVGPKGTLLTFYNNTFPEPGNLISFLQMHQGLLKLRPDQKLLIMRTWASPMTTMEGLYDFLSKMAAACLPAHPIHCP